MRAKSKPRKSSSSTDDESRPNASNGVHPSSITKTGKIRREHSHQWRMWEKEAFMDAFPKACAKKWLGKGSPDKELCEKILEDFKDTPGLTTSDIEAFIKSKLTKARRAQNRTDKCIDKWLEVVDAVNCGAADLEAQLSLVMMVAKQEPPDNTPAPPSFKHELPQPNFQAIYDYFSCSFTDRPLPELSPIDSLVVEDCMQSLTFQIEYLDDEGLRRSLRKIFLHFIQDPDKEPEQEHEEMRKNLFHNATALNPLGLNAQAIVPVVPE